LDRRAGSKTREHKADEGTENLWPAHSGDNPDRRVSTHTPKTEARTGALEQESALENSHAKDQAGKLASAGDGVLAAREIFRGDRDQIPEPKPETVNRWTPKEEWNGRMENRGTNPPADVLWRGEWDWQWEKSMLCRENRVATLQHWGDSKNFDLDRRTQP
jgi:hypothetical protein